MADPGPEAIMIGGIDDCYFRAHLFRAVDKFSALSGVNVLAGKRREEPRRAIEKIGVGKLHPRVFLAPHGMPREGFLTGVSPKRFPGAPDHFCPCSAHGGYQCLG